MPKRHCREDAGVQALASKAAASSSLTHRVGPLLPAHDPALDCLYCCSAGKIDTTSCSTNFRLFILLAEAYSAHQRWVRGELRTHT